MTEDPEDRMNALCKEALRIQGGSIDFMGLPPYIGVGGYSPSIQMLYLRRGLQEGVKRTVTNRDGDHADD